MKIVLQSATFLIIFCYSIFGMAKPFTLDKDIAPMRLDLAPMQNLPGAKGGQVTGITTEGGHYFYVKGHGMTQPVDVILEAIKPADVKLEIYLATWDKPLRTASTAKNALATHKLTAYGEFGIRVVGEPGVSYWLSIVANAEQSPQLASPFVKTPEVTSDTPQSALNSQLPVAEKAESTSRWLFIVIGLLVIIIGLLIALLMRKKTTVVPVVMWVGFTFCFQNLVDVPFVLASDEGAHYLDDSGPVYRPGDFFERPPRDAAKDDPWIPTGSTPFEGADKAASQTVEYLKRIKDGVAAWEAYQSLDTCMRIASPPAAPQVPSFCGVVQNGDGTLTNSQNDTAAEQCSECFVTAREQFNKARIDLEKLRVIYSCTKKMSNAAIASGDSMSGIHGYTGIYWQRIRQDISQSVDKMEKAYDQKYPELIGKLQQSLISMSICEAQYGMADWYDRTGFIYYEFMSDAYKRKD